MDYGGLVVLSREVSFIYMERRASEMTVCEEVALGSVNRKPRQNRLRQRMGEEEHQSDTVTSIMLLPCMMQCTPEGRVEGAGVTRNDHHDDDDTRRQHVSVHRIRSVSDIVQVGRCNRLHPGCRPSMFQGGRRRSSSRPVLVRLFLYLHV